jgi:hypothetical protein
MYDPYEKIARDSHKCPCCDRAFTPDEEDWFVKKVGDLIISTPSDPYYLSQIQVYLALKCV